MEQKPRADGARAPDVQLGGEHAEPTPKQNEPQRELDERTLRRSIACAYDAFHRRACDFTSHAAGSVSHTGSEVASRWAWRRGASLTELGEILGALSSLWAAAETIEHLEGVGER